MSPLLDPPGLRPSNVPPSASRFERPKKIAEWLSMFVPSEAPSAAGFQNIELRSPPAADPAKDAPCDEVDCSRTAKPPAWAAVVMAMTPAAEVIKKFLKVLFTDIPPTLHRPNAERTDCSPVVEQKLRGGLRKRQRIVAPSPFVFFNDAALVAIVSQIGCQASAFATIFQQDRDPVLDTRCTSDSEVVWHRLVASL